MMAPDLFRDKDAENLSWNPSSRNKAFSSTVDKGGLVINPIRPSSKDGGPERRLVIRNLQLSNITGYQNLHHFPWVC